MLFTLSFFIFNWCHTVFRTMNLKKINLFHKNKELYGIVQYKYNFFKQKFNEWVFSKTFRILKITHKIH